MRFGHAYFHPNMVPSQHQVLKLYYPKVGFWASLRPRNSWWKRFSWAQFEKKTRPNCVLLLWLHLGIILSLRSRLSRAASVLTRLIQPRSIDSTAGATIQWRVSAGEFDDHRELKMCKINPFSRPGGLEIILLPNKPTGLDFVAGAVFHAIKRGQTFLHFLAMWAPNIWCVYILPLILVQAYLYPRTRPINFGLWPAPSVAQKMNSGNKNPAMMGLFLGVDGSQIAAAVKTIEMFDV